MSPVRALRLAAEKAADEDIALVLGVRAVTRQMLDHAGLIAEAPDDALLLLLDGPDGAVGVMMLDPATIAAVIEMQTMGQVLARPLRDRPLTRTDAAMAAPLVDGVLRRFSRNMADQPDSYWTSGFQFGAMIDDRRSLGLALLAADYHLFRMELDLGSALRQGVLNLALPVRANPDQPRQDAANAAASLQFQKRVMTAPVRLDAVLCRLSVTLQDLGQLKVGDLLPVPPEALREVSLEAVGRRRVATGRLGQLDGMRALRLNLNEAASPQDAPRADHSALTGPSPSAVPLTEGPPPSVMDRMVRPNPMRPSDEATDPMGLGGMALGNLAMGQDPLASAMPASHLPVGLDGAYDDAAFALDDGPQP